MNTASQLPARSTWLVVWGALAAAPLVYGILAPTIAASVEPSPMLATLRATFLGVAAAGVAFGFLIMRSAARAADPPSHPLATRDDDRPASPAAFQTRSVIAMALFEALAVYGFVLVFLGAPALEYWPWGIASVAAQVGIVLPSGLSYWSEVERTGGTGPTG